MDRRFIDTKQEMLNAGWNFERRGAVEHWSFEDSGWMDFSDAKKLHLSCTPNEPEKKSSFIEKIVRFIKGKQK